MADTVQDDLRALVDRLLHIGTELSSQRDLGVLLELIVQELRRLTRADGGTLFLLDEDARVLRWAIVLNETLGVHIGGQGGQTLDGEVFKPLALDADSARSNVAAHVALTGEPVHIEDVYDAHDAFDFTGPQRFDAQTGYRTRSMLVVPLKHFDGGVVGVLQLINARDAHGQLVAFPAEIERIATALASQAAVAVKNALLFKELEEQFEAFIRAIAMAIDEKSRYTAGHVRRVVELAMGIASAIDASDDPAFAHIHFTADQMKALHIAAWMHDVGKIATPEYIVDKATKLEALHDRIELVRARFALAREQARADMWEAIARQPAERAVHEASWAATCAWLDDALEFVTRCNLGVEWMPDDALARLHSIAAHTLRGPDGQPQPLLTDDELKNLSIRKGTLTAEQIEVIRNHARISYKMLSELPFSRHLADVPEIAAGHHEKLNGQGYPRGLRGEQLSIQARILAIADIFEALTAADRPYKRPTMLSSVKRILDAMIRDGELDPEIVRVAMQTGVFDAYAEREVDPAQRDLVFRAL
jgi:HD-GYP domain-containing protein (c-di-GMP phosphodiesterase class II)